MNDRDDEFKRHFGTLWRTALVGLDTMREVVVRSTQTGRLRVDIALLQRERAMLLESLGETVMKMIDDGSFDAPESVREAYDHIRDVEGQLKNDSIKAHDNAFGAPRGYEPEAAADYGNPDDDDDADDTDDEDDEDEAVATPPARRAKASGARSTKKGAATKRKDLHR